MINKEMNSNRLISHSAEKQNLTEIIADLKNKLIKNGMDQYLNIIDKLSEFEFGRYLLCHRGINGYWTHFMLMNAKSKRDSQHDNDFTDFERYLLDKAPLVLATQQRFDIFLKENQKGVKNGANLACVPCGMMGELVYLDLSNVDGVKLTGIDLDPETLHDARTLVRQKELENIVTLVEKDAWELDMTDEFDLISSNGLTIYEKDDNKVIELYKNFYQALKRGGKLVTSFITQPPGMADHCEWDFTKINVEDLALQKIIFADILDVKWQCFRSTDQVKSQLEQAGFNDIHFVYDDARMFPAVVACK